MLEQANTHKEKTQFISRTYQTDEILFRQSEFGDTAYIIRSGRVEIYLEEQGRIVPLATFGKGDIFGEMFLFGGKSQKRTASCRALEKTEVINIGRNQLLAMLKDVDPILKHLILSLVNRLKKMNAKVSRLDTKHFHRLGDQHTEEIES